ncbi:MAG TPA: VWA domain-containing protein [Phycisphaerales bacterium]|nr:VWA domain-containing protein [Phycisphaerales bacterium]
MGYGDYSYKAHQEIVSTRSTKSREEVFRQRKVHPLMNPHGVKFRESRDSADHPNSLPIVFALDVTGSMGTIPELLAKTELPHFMQGLLASGVTDPQVMFLAFGDAFCDSGPLQVGQFESTAEDIDRWLTWSWLEGRGGGNGGESYDLAMYFAARHTITDSMERRNKRGYFFMTGDEPPFKTTSKSVVKSLIDADIERDIPLQQVVDELSCSYHPFFLIPDQGRRRVENVWRQYLGDHVLVLDQPQDTCHVAAGLVALCEGLVTDLDMLAVKMSKEGLTRQQVGSVVRAISPFAATLDKDGSGPVPVEPVAAW